MTFKKGESTVTEIGVGETASVEVALKDGVEAEIEGTPTFTVTDPTVAEVQNGTIKGLKKGDAVVNAVVKIKGQTSVGQVMEINGKNATVAFGSIKTTVKLDRLERSNAAPKTEGIAKSTFVSSQTHDQMYEKKLNFKQDIDVRGMRGDEALQAITYFVDDAILVGMDRVRILHGTGTGILRTLIRQYLSTVPGVSHYADEHVQFGGAGITVVDFD